MERHEPNPNNRRLHSLADLRGLPTGTRVRVIFDADDPEVGCQTGRKIGGPKPSVRWDDELGGGYWNPNEQAFEWLVIEEVSRDTK